MSRNRSVFTSTIQITTTIMDFSIDVVIYDGILSVYYSNTLLSSPFGLSSFLLISREIDNASINWGTKLQPVVSQSTSYLHVLLDMGYLHEHDHHYQTIVLYNRNPVEVQMTVFSSKVPNIHAFPIYRAQLTNQTISSVGTPSCTIFILLFTL